MKTEHIIAAFLGGFLVTIVLTILIGSKATVPVSAPLVFGLFILGFFGIFYIWTEMARWRSNSVISNVGHYSINTEKDIYHIPWQADLVGDIDRKNMSLGEMTYMFPGGIQRYGISTKSPPEYPVFIFPSSYEEREEKNLHIRANLKRVEFSELSPYIRHVLKYFKGRVKDDITPIYFGATSHMDGSTTPQNLKLEFENKAVNKQLKALEDRLDRMYRENRRSAEEKKPNILVEKIIKPYSDE